jgi:GNAT superfamily N-acetyltransferase
MAVLVRNARREDADAIADAHIASWRAAYRHIFPATVFDADDFDSSRREMWRAWTHSQTPDRRLHVAAIDGRAVGFAHTGHSDDEASLAATNGGDRFGELFGFYVHPDAWGSGAAGLLMDAALKHLIEIGHQRAVVWTLRDTARARHFYTKSGWSETGRTDTWTRYQECPVAEVEYVHQLPQDATLLRDC